MAKMVLTNASLVINSVDLSSSVKSVTLSYDADMQESTTMGAGTHTFLGGLKNWKMDVEFMQDFAASLVDATIFPIVGTAVTVALKPVNAATSATNPLYSGTGIISTYTPIGNSVGDIAMAPVTISPAGTLTRATA